MIRKILIANRGEIACRVVKTAKRMGIKTVAVYSEADAGALHTRMADEKYPIGPAPTNQSYLVVKNIMKAIAETGADAVHPGYGFLSENAAFARRLAKQNIVFIGPKPRAITAMGDKIESKKLAEKAGVNIIPGYTDAVKDGREAVDICDEIGYPVMLKASAGGGGKGMRVAWNAAEAEEGFERARSEAASSFGDDRIFIEKFIETPRHVEIQILADSHGNTIYLGERECSIQRRNQKVIEEAPSSLIDPETRKAMGEQAVALAKAVNYESTGTVEFIVDKNKNFYFLEMNTRIQVEHPITEYITGFDLVERMIRVASGERLGIKQEDVVLHGWAMEARIYAEDPSRGFLPSTGRLVRYRPPEESRTVRVDTGVFEGGEISMYYDPMIAKLVAHGTDRDAAIGHMRRALDEFYIKGVSHNIPFLNALFNHDRFVEGDISTNFIAEEYPDGFNASDSGRETSKLFIFIAVAACVHRIHVDRAAQISGKIHGCHRIVHDEWVVVINGENHLIAVQSIQDGHRVVVNGREHVVVNEWTIGSPKFNCEIDGKCLCVQVERENIVYRLDHAGIRISAMVLRKKAAEYNAFMPVKQAPDLSRFLLSPMPGLLVGVSVEPGQKVKSGEELCVIEAMKMENVMKADKDRVVSKLAAAPGDSLAVDQVILEFE